MNANTEAPRKAAGRTGIRWLLLAATGGWLVLWGLCGKWGPDPARGLAVAGYWIMAALFGCWAVAARYWLVEEGRELWRLLGWRGVVAVLCTWGVLATREPAEFKVLMDEPLLVDASLGMHARRSVATPATAVDLGGVRTYLGDFLDKRPLAFPFLLSLVHDLTGYRVENVFALNRALLLLLLVLGWLCGRKLDPDLGGPLMLLWFLGWPLVAQNASSGGFDLLNLVLVFGVLLATMTHAGKRTPTTEVFLLSTCLLLANTRYESVLFLAVYGFARLAAIVRRRDWSLPWFAACSPLFLLPYLWQRDAIMRAGGRWELAQRQVSRVWSPDYVAENLRHAWHFLVVPDRGLAGSPLFAALGVFALAGVCLFGLGAWRRRGLPGKGVLALLSLVGVVAANFALLMCYFWGDLADPLASRLALPLIGMMGLGLCALRPAVLPSRAGWAVLLAAMGIWIAGYALPSMNEHRYSAGDLQMRIFRWAQGVVAQTHCRKPMVVSTQERVWTAYRVAARNPVGAKASWLQLEYLRRAGEVDALFVVQHFTGASPEGPKRLLGGAIVPEGVTLELVAETSLYPFNYVRVSRVVAIDPERLTVFPPSTPGREGLFQGLSPAQLDDLRYSLP